MMEKVAKVELFACLGFSVSPFFYWDFWRDNGITHYIWCLRRVGVMDLVSACKYQQ